jgi:hypothetical protein
VTRDGRSRRPAFAALAHPVRQVTSNPDALLSAKDRSYLSGLRALCGRLPLPSGQLDACSRNERTALSCVNGIAR